MKNIIITLKTTIKSKVQAVKKSVYFAKVFGSKDVLDSGLIADVKFALYKRYFSWSNPRWWRLHREKKTREMEFARWLDYRVAFLLLPYRKQKWGFKAFVEYCQKIEVAQWN